MEFNHFNLKNRPFLNVPTGLSGEDGNIIKLGPLFESTMRRAGYAEEAQYFGGNNLMNIIQKVENFHYSSFMLPLIVSMTETNDEIEKRYEDTDEDIVIVRSKKKKDNQENYLGRNPLFYANMYDFKETLIDNYDEFLEKDKIGMTIIDHYLMAEKYDVCTLAMQYIYLNKSPEEYQSVIDNKVFGQSIPDSLIHKNMEMNLYYSLLQYGVDQSPELIKEAIKNIDDLIAKHKKVFVAEGHVGNFLELFKSMKEVVSGKPENMPFIDEVFSHVWVNFMTPGTDIYKELEKHKQLDSLIRIEKEYLNIETEKYTNDIKEQTVIRTPPKRL